MELKEFQGLALRTESRIENIKLNRNNLIALLEVVVEITEILDGVKKAAFYNKTTKLEGEFTARLSTLSKLVSQLEWQDNGRGAVGAVIDSNETISNVDPRVFHGILGIITESGELSSALLKSIKDQNHTIDAVNVQEEMSDIAWYEAILNDALGLDWNQGLVNVINKLRVRYPEKYSDDAAANRNLEAERRMLEVGNGNWDAGRRYFEEQMERGMEARRAIGIDESLSVEGRRVFYVNIPEGTSNEAMQDIIAELINRVRHIDVQNRNGE